MTGAPRQRAGERPAIRQAVILAGGTGSRLRPHTADRPKALVPVAGRSVLERQLRWLADHGVTHAVVSAGYLAHTIARHLASSRPSVEVRLVVEDRPLGRGGGMRLAAAQRPFPDEPWYGLNGDLLTDLALAELGAYHQESGAAATVALTWPPLPWGVATLDDRGFVRGFEEAPRSRDPVNAGVYAFDPSVLRLFPEQGDLELHTLPMLAARGELRGFPVHGYWRPIDTEKDLRAAEREVDANI